MKQWQYTCKLKDWWVAEAGDEYDLSYCTTYYKNLPVKYLKYAFKKCLLVEKLQAFIIN